MHSLYHLQFLRRKVGVYLGDEHQPVPLKLPGMAGHRLPHRRGCYVLPNGTAQRDSA